MMTQEGSKQVVFNFNVNNNFIRLLSALSFAVL
jgi:hypothetical protein